MISKDLLEILRCPNCVQKGEGNLKYFKEAWLICGECGRKYPVIEEIPVMLIKEGDKWVGVAETELPVPPPPVK